MKSIKKIPHEASVWLARQTPTTSLLLGLLLFAELVLFFKLFEIWGSMMGTFLLLLNIAVVVASVIFVQTVKEYYRKDFAYDHYQMQKIVIPIRKYGKTGAALCSHYVKLYIQSISTGIAHASKYAYSLAHYKMKSANITPAIMR